MLNVTFLYWNIFWYWNAEYRNAEYHIFKLKCSVSLYSMSLCCSHYAECHCIECLGVIWLDKCLMKNLMMRRSTLTNINFGFLKFSTITKILSFAWTGTWSKFHWDQGCLHWQKALVTATNSCDSLRGAPISIAIVPQGAMVSIGTVTESNGHKSEFCYGLG
jgi:hypothetical protein